MILKVNKDICEIKQNEVWNVGDYNVHTVQVELSEEFDGLVNKVRYFVEDNSYDMLITDNVAQVPYEATVMEGTIKIGVYGYDADTDILVQSTSPVNKYITSGTYTGEADNTEPLTPTDKQQMETAIQKNTNDITDLQNNKQDLLISGENIKTINNESILGSGNINIEGGGSGGTSNYNALTNKPKINNVELKGNKSLNDLGIQPKGNYALESEIPDVSNFITNTVDDLVNYYTKTETFTKQEVNNLISAITTMDIQVVQTLPVQDISTTTIYLVPKTTAETNDAYDEYIYVSNNWEHIGSTEVDLTGYATENWVNTQISEFLTQTQIQALINTALSEYTETDPTVPSYVKNITQANITSWNNKSDFSGNYNDLTNKPSINNVTLSGNKSLNDLGIQPAGNYALESDMTEAQNDIEALQTENERLKATLPTTTGEGQDITLDKTAEMEFVKPPLPRGNTKQNTTTGKNLLNTSNANTTTINGVTSYRNNGVYYLSGTNTKTDATWVLPDVQNTNLPTFEIGQTYTMSFKGTMPNGIYAQLNGFKTGTQYSIGSIRNTVPSVTFTIDSDYSSTAQLFIGIQGVTTNADCNFAIQIEKGSTATSYEPYTGGIPSPNPDYPQEVEVVTGNVEVTISNENNTESKTLPISLGNIKLCIIGNYQDVFIKENNDWKIPNKTIKIDNYNGETITTPYISTTGGLDIGATVYYVGTNDLLITDATLISQLEEISKTLSYQGQTNITSNTIALFNVEAYQDTKLILAGKANKISVVQTSASTIEINPNTFYKFGEVASLNITLASITDNTIYNEYMFEFVSGTTATTLTLPSSIKWLETPTIDANKIYQCSIVDNVGLLVGVTNV